MEQFFCKSILVLSHLCCIFLQRESETLHKREVQLREREKALRDAEKLSHTTDIIIDRVVTQEVDNRCQAIVEVTNLAYLFFCNISKKYIVDEWFKI